jgi:hypothetical protein
MQRRTTLQWIATSTLPASLAAHAHHGWSSFDLDRPIYLEGKASKVKWQNAHTELTLELSPGMKLCCPPVKTKLGKSSLPHSFA